MFEHAQLDVQRVEHGYCTDDVARALVVLAREPKRTPELDRLTEVCLTFVERAQLPDGRFHNRRSAEDGAWLDDAGPDDSIGRALYALGCAARSNDQMSERALACFEQGVAFDSPSPRANAWAACGGADVIAADPGNPAALALLKRVSTRLGKRSVDPDWLWPEARLAYDNARLPQARISAAIALDDEPLLGEGVELLDWLVRAETHDGHFSFAPVGGRGPGEPKPGFDQQPIEAGAMADACAAAFDATGDEQWAERALLAAEWFLGANDTGVPLLDEETGGGCDGLTREGRNGNQGAESTIALISAFQHAERLQGLLRSARSSSSVETIAAPTLRSAAP